MRPRTKRTVYVLIVESCMDYEGCWDKDVSVWLSLNAAKAAAADITVGDPLGEWSVNELGVISATAENTGTSHNDAEIYTLELEIE